MLYVANVVVCTAYATCWYITRVLKCSNISYATTYLLLMVHVTKLCSLKLTSYNPTVNNWLSSGMRLTLRELVSKSYAIRQ